MSNARRVLPTLFAVAARQPKTLKQLAPIAPRGASHRTRNAQALNHLANSGCTAHAANERERGTREDVDVIERAGIAASAW